MRTQFITSASAPAGFPVTELPEVAFVGRSNVGKSSLLNALAAAKIARTSRTPGRTQLVNFFSIHTKTIDYVLADLPGYGFARAPEAIRASWGKLIDGYLAKRAELRAVLFLFDLRRGAEEEDVALFHRLEQRHLVLAIGTKADKLGKAAIKPALASLAKQLGIPRDRTIATSTTKNMGIEELRARVEDLCRTD